MRTWLDIGMRERIADLYGLARPASVALGVEAQARVVQALTRQRARPGRVVRQRVMARATQLAAACTQALRRRREPLVG